LAHALSAKYLELQPAKHFGDVLVKVLSTFATTKQHLSSYLGFEMSLPHFKKFFQKFFAKSCAK